MDTGAQPLRQQDNKHNVKPLQHMRAGFKKCNPATEKKLACHPDLPRFVRSHAYQPGSSVAEKAVRDLVMIVYYCLLRVREYTPSMRRKLKTRTRQFRLKDGTFYKRNKDGKM